MMTRKGICIDLTVSPYRYKLDNIIYAFSSKFYMRKFIDGYKKNREEFSTYIERRFNKSSTVSVSIESDTLADIYFYSTIEKRGFHVEGGTPCQISDIEAKTKIYLKERLIITTQKYVD